MSLPIKTNTHVHTHLYTQVDLLSVLSFSSTKRRAQVLLLVTQATDLSLRAIKLFCCL